MRDSLTRAYAAFNARDLDAVLATMHPDVDWPNAWKVAASWATQACASAVLVNGPHSIPELSPSNS